MNVEKAIETLGLAVSGIMGAKYVELSLMFKQGMVNPAVAGEARTVMVEKILDILMVTSPTEIDRAQTRSELLAELQADIDGYHAANRPTPDIREMS